MSKLKNNLKRLKGVAAHFQISDMTLWRWRQDPAFPQPLKRGNVILFDVEEIQKWMANGEKEHQQCS